MVPKLDWARIHWSIIPIDFPGECKSFIFPPMLYLIVRTIKAGINYLLDAYTM